MSGGAAHHAELRDHLGRHVPLDRPAERIVCLCPSLTETLFALGAGGRVVGRTKFCIHPQPEVERVPAVGGTKTARAAAVLGRRPDLVIAEKEENRAALVAELEPHVAVFVADVIDFESALAAVRDLGRLTGRVAAAERLGGEIERRFAALPKVGSAGAMELPRPADGAATGAGADRPEKSAKAAEGPEGGPGLKNAPPRAVYLIWQAPRMAVGRGTYIDDLLRRIGLENVCGALPGRYPRLSEEELRILQPDLLLLSSEPYPFKAAHAEQYAGLLPRTRVRLVDGEMFSWYGSRMLAAAEYLERLVG